MQPIYDQSWRSRALRGDAAAVRLLAREALAPLYAFVLPRVGRRPELCEEVVQETLLAALGGLERYDPARAAGDVFPWLAGLARNEIRALLAREQAAVSFTALWASMDRDLLAIYRRLDAEPATDELLQREETRQLVEVAMSQLSPRHRRSLEEKYVQGRSVRDIAGLLCLSEKATESLLTRARQAFRETFMALTRNLETELP